MLRLVIHSLLCLIPDGPRFGMYQPVCSSWIWINRSTSKRSKAAPLGDESLFTVQQANQMVSRTILAMLVNLWYGGDILLEEWVGDLYRRFTREMRQEAEELREILGYEKPTRVPAFKAKDDYDAQNGYQRFYNEQGRLDLGDTWDDA
ncbi:unnamed protein product, partial [Symbiodinium pilosum]